MLYFVVDRNPYQLRCPGSSVGRALSLDCRVLWVRIPPRAAIPAVLGVVDLFVMPLPFYLVVYTYVTSFIIMRATVNKFED